MTEERQRYPRRFYLMRHEDKTGISGTGVVADGVVWQTGAATLNWRGGGESYNTWPGPNAISEIERIHGHGGLTGIVWRDDEDGYPFHEQTGCPYEEYMQGLQRGIADVEAGRVKPVDRRHLNE